MIFNSINRKLDDYDRMSQPASLTSKCGLLDGHSKCICMKHQQIYNQRRYADRHSKYGLTTCYTSPQYAKLSRLNEKIQNQTNKILATGTRSCYTALQNNPDLAVNDYKAYRYTPKVQTAPTIPKKHINSSSSPFLTQNKPIYNNLQQQQLISPIIPNPILPNFTPKSKYKQEQLFEDINKQQQVDTIYEDMQQQNKQYDYQQYQKYMNKQQQQQETMKSENKKQNIDDMAKSMKDVNYKKIQSKQIMEKNVKKNAINYGNIAIVILLIIGLFLVVFQAIR